MQPIEKDDDRLDLSIRAGPSASSSARAVGSQQAEGAVPKETRRASLARQFSGVIDGDSEG